MESEQSDHMTSIENYDDSEFVMLKVLGECSGGSSGSQGGSDDETRTICGSPATVSHFSRIWPTSKTSATAEGVLS